MIGFVIWVCLCFLVAMAGTNKNIGYWGTFFLSLILSPLIGLIIALISSSKVVISNTVTVTSSKEYTCKHCGLKTNVNSHFCPTCDKDDKGFTKEHYYKVE